MGERDLMDNSNDQYLDKNLIKEEKYDKICISSSHLSRVYTTVDEYLLYRYFQGIGNPLSDDIELQVGGL